MRVGELARQTGTTVRALRYYERVGLVVPSRLANGYRDYEPLAVKQVAEIRDLTALGLSVEQTRPFVECIALGHGSGDDCVSSLAAYRHAIDSLDERIAQLSERRDALEANLEAAASGVLRPAAATTAVSTTTDERLAPDDDEAGHLVDLALPPLALAATDGSTVVLDSLGPGRTVIYVYPLTGRPGDDMPDGWDNIPGARGCTPEACGFRDHHDELQRAGARAVFGLSSQTNEYQRELVDRLRLPFAVLADPELQLAAALGLPTFAAGGMELYRRLTLVITDGSVEHVFYPVTQPADHATEVVRWLEEHD